jgi:hypothetical protein
MRSSFVHCTECGFDFPAAAMLADGKHLNGFDDKCGPCAPIPDPGTVIGYQILESDRLPKLVEDVLGLAAEGWDLHGPLVICGDGWNVQRTYLREMVLRAKAEV